METNENAPEENASPDASISSLPYRSVFAVLTQDSVLIYDTYHDRPLCIARGLHYAGLTDCTWSVDGRQLIVSSTDGYLSILSFDENEFGQVYTLPKAVTPPKQMETERPKAIDAAKPAQASSPRIPPCEPGQTATIEARPAKRAKTRITSTLISVPTKAEKAPTTASATGESKKIEDRAAEEQAKPNKKRIQPTLVSANP
jgi:chromatin assembly factor 1 subunit B